MRGVFVLVLLLPALLLFAQQEITLLDEIYEVGAFGDIVVLDNILLAPNIKGLKLYDISDPTSPVHINTLNTPGRSVNLAVSGNYLYLFDIGYGIILYDITNPSSPCLLDTFPYFTGLSTNAYPNHWVILQDDIAYYQDYDEYPYLRALDIGNPLAPVPRDSMRIPNYNVYLHIRHPYCYLTDGTLNLYLIDISDPDSLCVVDTFSLVGYGKGIASSGDYLYVGTDYPSRGVQVFNISDPSSPDSAGYFHDEWYTYYSFVIDDSVMYGYRHGGRLVLFDISSPTLIDTFGLANFQYGGGGGYICREDTLLFMTSNRSTTGGDWYGIGIAGISDPVSPNNLSINLTDKGPIQFARIASDYLVLANPGEIFCYSLDDPTSPSEISSYNASNVRDIAVGQDYVYNMNSWNYMLEVLSLPDLSLVSSFSTSEYQYLLCMTEAGGYLFGVRDTLRVYQVIGDSLQQIGSYPEQINTMHLFACDTLLFFYDYPTSFRVFSTSCPGTPYPLAEFDPGRYLYYSAFLIDGEYGYFLFQDSLLIYDFTGDYSVMGYVGSVWLEDFVDNGDIAIQDTFLYITGENYISIFNTADPVLPEFVDRYNTSGIPQWVAPYGDYAYLADNTSLGIYHFQATGVEEGPYSEEMGFSLTVRPDPSSGIYYISYSTGGEDNVRIGIYDVTGRLIRQFSGGLQERASGELIWDCRDRRGFEVSRGIYFCLLEAGDSKTTEKILKIK